MDQQKITGEKVVINFIWRFMERVGAQGVAFIVSIVLARLLDPALYGTIALVTVFTGILQVFVDGGLGNALIQKAEVDDVDFSSVFYFNVVMCIVLYIGMYFCAPLIARFYRRDELVPLIRVLSLILVISGVKNILQAYVSRKLIFKKFFYATLAGTVGAAIIGIWMAYKGYGVWALVAQTLFNAAIDTLILWLTVGWRPKWVFSFQRLRELLSYSWKLLVSDLLDTAYQKLHSLVIGRVYTSDLLAFYNRGEQFPQLVTNNLASSINSVLMPTLSREQDDREAMKSKMRRSIRIGTYIMMPLMAGLASCAEPLVRIVLTAKWLPCVPFLRVFCLMYMFYPVAIGNLNAIKANGRSDLFLQLEVVKKILGFTVLMLIMRKGAFAIALAVLFCDAVEQGLNMIPNRMLINHRIRDQILDILPNFLLSIVMGGIVWAVQFLGLSDWLTLLIQIPAGILIYVFGSKLFRNDNFDYTLSLVKRLIKK